MSSFKNILIFATVLILATSFRLQEKFITFNSSSNQNVASISIASNLDKEFSIYSPLLINTKESLSSLTPVQSKGKFVVQPKFIKDEQLLYNDFHQGQFWYGFKKHIDQTQRDTFATFSLLKVSVNEETHDYIMPLFSLPLSFISFKNLYRCGDVLISYKKTDKLIDITVFGTKLSWHLFPEALWGFRNRNDGIDFSRQTFSLGTTVQIDVGKDNYCVLGENLEQNSYNLTEKQIFTLEDLLSFYSTKLEFKSKEVNQEL